MLRVAPVLALLALLCAGRVSAAPILDPPGDTFNSGAIDLTSYEFVFDGSSILVTLTFAGPIAPASALAANSVFGYIDLDTDKDPSTGVASYVNEPGKGIPGLPVALGVDFSVDLLVELIQPGFVDIWKKDGSLDPVATTAIVYGASSLSFELLPEWLDGAIDFDAAILVGDVNQPTDRAPNEGVAVPEPATLSLLAAGIAALGVARRKAVGRR